MLKKLTQFAMAATLIAATTVATTQDAEARKGGRAAGVIAGTIIGLGLLGAYAHSRDRSYRRYDRACYSGRRVCDVVGQRCWYNRYGEYVCKDQLHCYHPRICH